MAASLITMVCQNCGYWQKRIEHTGVCPKCGSARIATHCPACYVLFQQTHGNSCRACKQLLVNRHGLSRPA